MPMIHRKFGGSTCARTLECPGWVDAGKNIPDQPSSSYAERGTNLHDIQEMLRNDDKTPDEVDYGIYGAEAQDYEDATRLAYGLTEEVLDMFDCEYLQTELFLDGPLADTGGSMDLIAWNDETFVMMDYKMGNSVVNADKNVQGLFYFWLLWNDKEWGPKLEGRQLVFGIIQPCQGSPSLWVIQPGVLEKFDAKFRAAYIKAGTVSPPLSCGSHCQYCKARSVCTAQKGYAQRALTLDPTDKATLTEALSMAKQLESWSKEVFKEAQRFLEMGEQVAGWKLVEKRAVRKWDDEAAVITGLYRALGRDQYFTEKLKSPAQVEKLKKVPPAKIKLFAKHTVKKSSGVTIAPEADKRSAVSMEIPSALKALVKDNE